MILPLSFKQFQIILKLKTFYNLFYKKNIDIIIPIKITNRFFVDI